MNNNVHESVGGQKTAIDSVDVLGLLKSVNYKKVKRVRSDSDLTKGMNEIVNVIGPNFMEIKVKSGSRADLGRPSIKPIDNKTNLMEFVKDK